MWYTNECNSLLRISTLVKSKNPTGQGIDENSPPLWRLFPGVHFGQGLITRRYGIVSLRCIRGEGEILTAPDGITCNEFGNNRIQPRNYLFNCL
jgi:hypothetical protein